jgi:uncharacterized membrane protein
VGFVITLIEGVLTLLMLRAVWRLLRRAVGWARGNKAKAAVTAATASAGD